MWRLLEWTVLAFLAQVLSAFAEEMAGNAFTDPTLIWRQVPPDWETQTVRAQPGASEADLSVTLDQQLYPMLLPLIQQYAAEHRVKVAVSNGTCGISAGLLSRKAVDVGGFCCPPGLTDRLPGLRFHTLAVAAIALLVHRNFSFFPGKGLDVVDDNSSSLDEKKRLTQRQEIISVSSQVHQL